MANFVDILIREKSYKLEVASSPEEQSKGLSGKVNLPASQGMIFVFPFMGTHVFHMVGMNFPLDILWIDFSGKIQSITHDVPPAMADATLESAPKYMSPVPISMAIELVGGSAKRAGIKAGEMISVPQSHIVIVKSDEQLSKDHHLVPKKIQVHGKHGLFTSVRWVTPEAAEIESEEPKIDDSEFMKRAREKFNIGEGERYSLKIHEYFAQIARKYLKELEEKEGDLYSETKGRLAITFAANNFEDFWSSVFRLGIDETINNGFRYSLSKDTFEVSAVAFVSPNRNPYDVIGDDDLGEYDYEEVNGLQVGSVSISPEIFGKDSKGVGTKLMYQLAEEFLSGDFDVIYTEPLNEHVRKYYEKFGLHEQVKFYQIGTKKDIQNTVNKMQRFMKVENSATFIKELEELENDVGILAKTKDGVEKFNNFIRKQVGAVYMTPISTIKGTKAPKTPSEQRRKDGETPAMGAVGSFHPGIPKKKADVDVRIDKEDIKILNEWLNKRAPPGPPPREGLVWKPQTSRWIRPKELDESKNKVSSDKDKDGPKKRDLPEGVSLEVATKALEIIDEVIKKIPEYVWKDGKLSAELEIDEKTFGDLENLLFSDLDIDEDNFNMFAADVIQTKVNEIFESGNFDFNDDSSKETSTKETFTEETSIEEISDETDFQLESDNDFIERFPNLDSELFQKAIRTADKYLNTIPTERDVSDHTKEMLWMRALKDVREEMEEWADEELGIYEEYIQLLGAVDEFVGEYEAIRLRIALNLAMNREEHIEADSKYFEDKWKIKKSKFEYQTQKMRRNLNGIIPLLVQSRRFLKANSGDGYLEVFRGMSGLAIYDEFETALSKKEPNIEVPGDGFSSYSMTKSVAISFAKSEGHRGVVLNKTIPVESSLISMRALGADNWTENEILIDNNIVSSFKVNEISLFKKRDFNG